MQPHLSAINEECWPPANTNRFKKQFAFRHMTKNITNKMKKKKNKEAELGRRDVSQLAQLMEDNKGLGIMAQGKRRLEPIA